ncbi:MAG: nucleotidyltransferase domain-containing protein [Ignavibacteriaceae bacterium]|jgi:predicted nucleotidyltransferase
MLSSEIISGIKKRILSKYPSEKIILFGSQATGKADTKSDIDLLLVRNSPKNKFKLMDQITSDLLTLNYAFDVIILSLDEFNRDKKYPGTVARYASQEGIVLYG